MSESIALVALVRAALDRVEAALHDDARVEVLERDRRADDATEQVRARLAAGEATAHEILSTVRARHAVARASLQSLVLRGEVVRTARGYRLAHAPTRTVPRTRECVSVVAA